MNCVFYFDNDYNFISCETGIETVICLLVPFYSFRYVVSYAQHGYVEPQRLTQGGFSHAATLNEV